MTNITSNTRKAVMDALVEIAKKDKSIVVVCADSQKSMKASEFKEKYPDRYYDLGIAEQNAVGFAAGLASCGLKPYVATYAGFLTMRAREQIRTYVAYPNLNVKFIGANGGIGGGEREGVTHQFFEDLGIMRSLPSMTILSPADGPEVYKATMSLHQYEGPAYLRVGNGREPKLFNDEINFELGKIRIIKNIGKDVVLFSTGPILKRTIKAAELLKKEGIKATVVEVPTLKPLDKDEITNVLEETGAVVTIEDHNIIGGLGSAIAEAGAGHITVPMERIGLQDVFPESGETEELLDKYKMGVSDIVNSAKKVYNKTNQ